MLLHEVDHSEALCGENIRALPQLPALLDRWHSLNIEEIGKLSKVVLPYGKQKCEPWGHYE